MHLFKLNGFPTIHAKYFLSQTLPTPLPQTESN